MTLEHWAAYYRGGAIVSCPTTTDPNYTLEVRDAWVEFFSALPDGARILDLGTGNGPVALIAKETAANLSRSFIIDAVDLAVIDPPQHVPDGESLFEGIRFHSGVSTEALPFDDSTMDRVSGQYILEYTDAKKTIAETGRVLIPGGRCQFILHHGDSLVVRNAAESLRHADLALRDKQVMRKFRRYCEADTPRKAETAKNNLLSVGAELQATATNSENPLFLQYLIDSVNRLLQHRQQLGPGEMLRQTDRLERELKYWVRRLKDLVAAARSSDDMEAIVNLAAERRFRDVSYVQQFQDKHNLVGWRLHMTKSPA
jgi:ubiquinone/menaquinone biosynthesis C-methylase UbiE